MLREKEHELTGHEQMATLIDQGPYWLSHLAPDQLLMEPSAVLRAYLVALEGWRRGLTLNIQGKRCEKFTLSSKIRTHHFDRCRIDLVTPEAVSVERNKGLTKEFLSKAGLRVAPGKTFDMEVSDEAIVKYAFELGYPVVLKPVFSSLAKGVVTGIKNEKELREALKNVRVKLGFQKIMVEEHVKGLEYRLMVLGEEVLSAYLFTIASVKGTGKDSIETLISTKNKERSENPYLRNYPIIIDTELLGRLADLGFSLEHVPSYGDVVFLRDSPGTQSGGESIDITDLIPEMLKKQAVKAVAAIPGLHFASIDLFVTEADCRGNPVVFLELNSKPQLEAAVYPSHGKARDIPAALIDYFFPETIPHQNKNRNYYINLTDALLPLKLGIASGITLTPMPEESIEVRHIIVSGKLERLGYEKWIQKKAYKKNISGFVRALDSNKFEIIAAGRLTDLEDFKIFCAKGPKKALVSELKDLPTAEPVFAGFLIKKGLRKKQIGKARSLAKKAFSKKALFRYIISTRKKLKHYLFFFAQKINWNTANCSGVKETNNYTIWDKISLLPKVETIIDVGVGPKGTPGLYRHFPNAKFLFVDPLIECREAVKSMLNERNIFINCALGDFDGTVEMNIALKPSRSSILNRTHSAKSTGVDRRLVALRRLDSVIADLDLPEPYGLKIDVEGYELEVLKGAKKALGKSLFLIIEFHLRDALNNQYTLHDLIIFIHKTGLEAAFMLRDGRNIVFVRNQQLN